MTIKDLAELLVEQGHDVKLRKRADGGYIISKIDGVSFKGASGNIQARRITGEKLSHAREYQLARIKPPKNVAPMMRVKPKLPDDLIKKLRKVQREWRKTHKDIGGTISVRGLRYQYETYGKESAMASLDKSYRYSQGYAYFENIQWLIERLNQLSGKLDQNEQQVIERIISKIQNKAVSFKEEWIHEFYQEIYEAEKGVIDVEELERRLNMVMFEFIQ